MPLEEKEEMGKKKLFILSLLPTKDQEVWRGEIEKQ